MKTLNALGHGTGSCKTCTNKSFPSGNKPVICYLSTSGHSMGTGGQELVQFRQKLLQNLFQSCRLPVKVHRHISKRQIHLAKLFSVGLYCVDFWTLKVVWGTRASWSLIQWKLHVNMKTNVCKYEDLLAIRQLNAAQHYSWLQVCLPALRPVLGRAVSAHAWSHFSTRTFGCTASGR